MTNNTNDFLPQGYEAPKSQGQNYVKLEKGENKIRILSKPIIGWLDWKDNKPLRFPMNEKPTKPIDPDKPIKHFWAFVVWSYNTNSIAIMEITQATIQHAIQALSKDQDWGNPFRYDIKIIKSGEKLDTEYTVNPVPHKPVTAEVQNAFMLKGEIKLTNLFSGGDPFENARPVEAVKEVEPLSDMPF